MSRRCSSNKFRACSPILARAPHWSKTSSQIGCRFVTYGCSIRMARSFPGFDDNLRSAFVTETEMFLDAQLKEDRSVTRPVDVE